MIELLDKAGNNWTRRRVVATRDSPRESDAWLVDHAWVFDPRDARGHLRAFPALTQRMCTMLGLPDSGDESLLHDSVLNSMWPLVGFLTTTQREPISLSVAGSLSNYTALSNRTSDGPCFSRARIFDRRPFNKITCFCACCFLLAVVVCVFASVCFSFNRSNGSHVRPSRICLRRAWLRPSPFLNSERLTRPFLLARFIVLRVEAAKGRD